MPAVIVNPPMFPAPNAVTGAGVVSPARVVYAVCISLIAVVIIVGVGVA
jgi:hypothetical protein